MCASVYLLFYALLCGAILCAQETTPLISEQKPIGEPWLGLSVSKPEDVTTTQLPLLPPGIGFVVTEVVKGGPAEKAGIRKHDLFWKMNEQMLVNEGQLATLLRLSAPGEEVTVSVFRDGQSHDLSIILGQSEVVQSKLSDLVIRPDDGTIQIMNLEEKKAVVTDSRGSAELTRRDAGDYVRIVNTKGKLIYEGIVSDHSELTTMPEGWRKQVCAMRRGLNHALSATPAPAMRQPRPRIVIPTPVE